jgi:cation:H+ antiporter
MGFGTSTPEMLVSGLAAASGAPDVGAGNVVGSNLANLTLVLGAAALVAPLTITSRVIRREVPFTVAASVAFVVALQSGFTRWEGFTLIGLLVVALVALVLGARNGVVPDPLGTEISEFLDTEQATTTRRELVRTAFGLTGTLVGAQVLVWGALGIADELSLSGGFVGMTIVAAGTSLPELVTAAQAARRGETDLIVGNLLGSNVFNALAVGGLVAVIAPGPLDEPGLTGIGAVAMLAASVLALVLMRTGYRVSRVEAAFLMAGYVTVLPLLR